MLETPEQFQVNDRFFSPVFAEDAAKILWERVMKNASHYDRIIHVGNPIRCSRYTIAQDLIEISNGELDIKIHPVSHNYFSSDTKRPEDTTWKENHSLYKTEYLEGLRKYYLQWKKRTSWI
jgi:dTDP-4-dehydrorhamnose reductase